MRNINFLVVDGKMFVNMVKNIIITKFGANKVYTATNGEDALALLETKKIDMIIADWELRRLSGEELLCKVRSHERYSEIPFVVMSGDGGKEVVVNAVQSGASQFVVKPFSPEKLDDAIRKAWNSAQKRQARRYSGLPAHHLKIHCGGEVFQAQVQNISRSGLLMIMTFKEQLKLFGKYEMSIEFDDIDSVGIINVSPLPAQIIRLGVAESFHPSTLKCEIAWIFAAEKFDQETKENLTRLFTFLKNKEQAQLKQE
ncbi:MAG: CheY-like chemotaxis protein [Phenylobacterium sp.]